LIAQAGSATSTRLRGTDPNAYNRITVENGRANVEVRVWTGTEWRSAETSLNKAKEAARERDLLAVNRFDESDWART